MKITLTLNEVLTLISEGMTMNNCQSLANKLRNADAPVIYPSNDHYNEVIKLLEKAKQTESTLRKALEDEGERLSRMTSKIRDLENDAKQDDESLKYFRKWVEEFRYEAGCDKGLTTAAVFSDAISYVKDYKTNAELLRKTESNLEKANDVISNVKAAYDHEGWTLHKAICEISDTVEAYYRGN